MIKSFLISLTVLTSTFSEKDTLKLLFLGDIMAHQAQLDAAYRDGDKDDHNSYDFSSYYEYLKKDFNEADLVCANIETTFGGAPYSGYPVFSSPLSLASQSFNNGIDIFLAANNHICDKGAKGLSGAIEVFDSIGVFHTGIYRDFEEEYLRHPLNLRIRGFKISILNYTYGTNGFNVPEPYIVKMLDTTVVKRDLAKAIMADPDKIIVCVHWGDEYSLKTNSHQEWWENFFYKYGADIIVGSHSHVPQKVTYKEENGYSGEENQVSRITAFSLGNAISNMSIENTRIGIMLEVNIVKKHPKNSYMLPPKAHYIWTVRPYTNQKNYSIIPIDRYLKEPEAYPNAHEYERVKYFYNKFNK